MSVASETFDFQVEARQLLRLMINSIYSDKDLFLRELISNASDALDKVRLERFGQPDLDVEASDLHIELAIDEAERTLTVRDNGIGMSRTEVVDLIGTIANSGTAGYLGRLGELPDAGNAAEELIGRFGVGFYASFMVADRVILVTRRAGEAGGTRWESDGGGTYTLEPVETASQGTSVTLHLKPADPDDRLFDYTDPSRIREIVTRYSDFITWPIRMAPFTASTSTDDDAGDGDGPVLETVNSRTALWARPAADVTEEEYGALYRRISHDWNDPLETIRLQIEGTLQYQALLFIPGHASPDLFVPGAARGLQLYVNRVFVMDTCEDLIPGYLRFVKGVVDSADLALNVSREILQQDRQIEAMRRRLTKKILAAVKTMTTERPQNYTTFWNAFGQVLKEGLLQDPANREAILQVCSFETTREAGARTTLLEYLDRMDDLQEHIYYLTGRSRAVMENSPYLEAFKAKGIEVLLLTDPIDEVWVDALPEFAGVPLQSVTKGEVDLGGDESGAGAEGRAQQRDEFAELLSWLTAALEKDVKEVRLSSRLTSSPACIVGETDDASPALVSMYRAMGQHIPQAKRILELNPGHPLVEGLRAAQAARPDDERVRGTGELLYGLALLSEGGQLDDPSDFVQQVAQQLSHAL